MEFWNKRRPVVIIRHVDQLCHRVATTNSSDVSVPGTGDNTDTVESELAETDQNNSDISETPETQTTPSPTPAQESDSSEATGEQTEDHSGDTDVVPSREHESPEQPGSHRDYVGPQE